MPDGHLIHRLHEFLPHLLLRQPELLSLLPVEERPAEAMNLHDWVWSLPQRRLLEICAEWVVESMRQLKINSPLSSVMMRGCLCFGGEFNLSDCAAVAVGEIPGRNDPRREEIRAALQRAVRLGVLIYLPKDERYCVPFPVRLSFDGADMLGPLEFDTLRLRMVRHFAEVAREHADDVEAASPKHWRFSNMMSAYESAVDLTEDYLGLEAPNWAAEADAEHSIPETLAEPLMEFGRFLGPALALLQSASGPRLLGASAAAAREHGSTELEADIWALLGQYHLRQRQFPLAIRSYRVAVRLRLSVNDCRGAILHHGAIGIALREMGDVELAAQEFLGACRLARKERLLEQEVDTANCASQLLLEMDRTFETIRLFREVEKSLSGEGERLPAFGELLVHLAIALRRSGHSEEARTALREAVERARHLSNRPIEARARIELAALARESGRMARALSHLEEARAIFTEMGDHAGLAECYLADARLHVAETDVDAAMESLRRGAIAGQEAGDHALLAEIHGERGMIAQAQGNLHSAIGHYSDQIAELRKTRHVGALVAAHLRIADIYLAQGALIGAGTEALRAQAIARAWLRDETPPEMAQVIERLYTLLSPEQIDFLVDSVSEELESGKLKKK